LKMSTVAAAAAAATGRREAAVMSDDVFINQTVFPATLKVWRSTNAQNSVTHISDNCLRRSLCTNGTKKVKMKRKKKTVNT